MLRTQLKRVSLTTPRIHHGPCRNRLGTRTAKRTISNINFSDSAIRVPLLRPTLWALAATTTIYLGCAAFDVYRDVRRAKKRGILREGGRVGSYDEFEYDKRHGRPRHSPQSEPAAASHHSPLPSLLLLDQLRVMLAGHTDAEKVIMGCLAVNISALGATYLAGGAALQPFIRFPMSSPPFTLLTNVFCHSSALDACLTGLLILQPTGDIAQSHIFQGNGSHMTAFYFSTAILSTLGDQFATVLPSRTYRFNRFLPISGSGGMAMAMLGAWATLQPESKVGMMFIPGLSFSIKDIMAALAVYNTVGIFVGMPFVTAHHGAHLCGLALGSGYVYFGGEKRIWRPTRKVAFYSMKALRII
ncbi:uncharacterized protein GGS25DRAFT_499051 [Hypoxylon fragiforme]|uniref:uncharacterized protein n=1 Tax=Hypoxylon fragiforme TaxID=63214 RepID=UPI0020C6F0D1|nr:uncharacterized protein GGS25DRAFT_499051 [Hypoxylon fragiforme]KAI2605992.1 hypothetical protein GGS25DRAFT_499051 [Hypoxylon fragiforme]